jgi:hypothetical protein
VLNYKPDYSQLKMPFALLANLQVHTIHTKHCFLQTQKVDFDKLMFHPLSHLH